MATGQIRFDVSVIDELSEPAFNNRRVYAISLSPKDAGNINVWKAALGVLVENILKGESKE